MTKHIHSEAVDGHPSHNRSHVVALGDQQRRDALRYAEGRAAPNARQKLAEQYGGIRR